MVKNSLKSLLCPLSQLLTFGYEVSTGCEQCTLAYVNRWAQVQTQSLPVVVPACVGMTAFLCFFAVCMCPNPYL